MNHEPKSGWNLPPGLMRIPETRERVYDPECINCYGTGTVEVAISYEETPHECDCWEDYDPSDCDPRHEYNYGE